MKRVNKVLFVAALAGMVSFTASSAHAITETQKSAIEKSLQKTPAIELAAKAVDYVNKAVEADRKATAILVVRTAVAKNPASAASVVSAVSSILPELAPKLVAAVAEVAPDQTVAAARVATRVAPEQAEKIVAELSMSSPKTMAAVSTAVTDEKAAIAKLSKESESSQTIANAGRAFPPGSGGKVTKSVIPINPRLKFPTLPPKSVSNYAAPGADPNRPF